MDRRTFLSSSLGVAAMGCAVRGLDGLAPRNRAPAHLLVLIDAAMPISRSYAAHRQGADTRYLGAGADLGMLWYETLLDWPGRIAGVVRPSDCFVLRSLSLAYGRDFYSTAIGPHAQGRTLDAWAIAFEIAAGPHVTRQ